MTLTIPANDHGQIRVFAVSGDLPAGEPEEVIAALFGTDALDPTYVDIISKGDLGVMALTDYIRQGYDMSPDDHDAAAVDGIEGHVVLILSRAAQGAEVTLTPAPNVQHVTTYIPPAQMTPVAPLRSDAADGIIGDPPGKAPKSDARIGGMVAMVALLVLFALVGLMVWVGG